MKKIILTNLLIFVLAVISPMHAEAVVKHAEAGGLAAGGIVVTPKWNDVSSVSLSLTTSGNQLRSTLTVVPKSGVGTVRTKGTLYLEKRSGSNWVYVTSWSVNQTGNVVFSRTYNGSYGNTYRARFSGTAGSESISITSTEKSL